MITSPVTRPFPEEAEELVRMHRGAHWEVRLRRSQAFCGHIPIPAHPNDLYVLSRN